MFKPLSGILNQPKMIPLRYCPITIELELVNNMTDVVIATPFQPEPDTPAEAAASPEFLESSCSMLWEIINVQAKCDVLTLDNSLDNSYAEHLLSGKSLPISYNTYFTNAKSIVWHRWPTKSEIERHAGTVSF